MCISYFKMSEVIKDSVLNCLENNLKGKVKLQEVQVNEGWNSFKENNWRGECKTLLSDDLGEKKNCGEKAWILACGLCFVWEALLWSFFCRVPLSFRELTYAKNAFVSLCYDKPNRSFVMISQRRPLFKVEVKSQSLQKRRSGNRLFTSAIVTWNTTRESIERQTKYHRRKRRCDALELCQLIS